jgi:Protein of unknown function (DUF3618)
MGTERTREELGKTVEALAAKADVKAARDKVVELSAQLPERAGHLKDQVAAQAAKATASVREAAPEQLQRTAKRTAAVIGAALAAIWLMLRKRRGTKSAKG